MIMLISPPQRNCLGSVCANFAMSRFAAAGIQEGQDALEHQVQRKGAAEISPQFGPTNLHRHIEALQASAEACGCGLLKYLK